AAHAPPTPPRREPHGAPRAADGGAPATPAQSIESARLTLVPATVAHVRAELAGAEQFASLLGAGVPASWPPGEYDRAAQLLVLRWLEEAGPAGVGWFGWYAVRRADPEAPATAVGSGGYFGPPTARGVVEIGYSMCPEWRGRGYATEMALALARRAAAQPGVASIVARTTVGNFASIAVLERSGFARAESGPEPGTLRFEWAFPG
ncbi:MAG: GNAT family N-acetyltransferase, partial [Gemmatimonadaceae bacterium]